MMKFCWHRVFAFKVRLVFFKLQNEAFLKICVLLSFVKVYYRVEESSDESTEESSRVVCVGVIEKEDNTNVVDSVVEIEERTLVEEDDDGSPTLLKGL